MIWIDRLGLVSVGLVWLAMGFFAFTYGNPQGELSAVTAIECVIVFAGIPWLVLRCLYFIITGRLTRADSSRVAGRLGPCRVSVDE